MSRVLQLKCLHGRVTSQASFWLSNLLHVVTLVLVIMCRAQAAVSEGSAWIDQRLSVKRRLRLLAETVRQDFPKASKQPAAKQACHPCLRLHAALAGRRHPGRLSVPTCTTYCLFFIQAHSSLQWRRQLKDFNDSTVGQVFWGVLLVYSLYSGLFFSVLFSVLRIVFLVGSCSCFRSGCCIPSLLTVLRLDVWPQAMRRYTDFDFLTGCRSAGFCRCCSSSLCGNSTARYIMYPPVNRSRHAYQTLFTTEVLPALTGRS